MPCVVAVCCFMAPFGENTMPELIFSFPPAPLCLIQHAQLKEHESQGTSGSIRTASQRYAVPGEEGLGHRGGAGGFLHILLRATCPSMHTPLVTYIVLHRMQEPPQSSEGRSTCQKKNILAKSQGPVGPETFTGLSFLVLTTEDSMIHTRDDFTIHLLSEINCNTLRIF